MESAREKDARGSAGSRRAPPDLETRAGCSTAGSEPNPRWLRPRSRLDSWPFQCLAITALIVLLVVICDDLSQHASIQSGNKIAHIASLGSSFASGPGIPPQVNRHAGRSGNNYAALLADRLDGVNLTDLAVSGATLLHLISEPQRVPGHTFAPQVEDLPADVDLVLVLGGGNDLDYVGGLMRDHGAASDVDVPLWTYDYEGTALQSADALARRYDEVLDAIHETAPDAVVLVVEYLTLLGLDFQPGKDAPFDSDRARQHKRTGEMLHNGTMRAIEGREDWCHVVEVARLSESHGIGSDEPWVTDYRGMSIAAGVPYHPNAAGMEAVEKMIFRKMVELDLIDDDEL